MMELSHSLTLNEEALNQLPSQKKPIFIFEWLHFLDKVLSAANKSDIKGCQQQLVCQLVEQMNEYPGPPTRKLMARCLATLFSVGDTFLLFDTINKCNDILKNKDDSASFLPTRLAVVTCIGAMYEKLGRMMGRSYEETVLILIKTFRNTESQLRIEIMITLEKIIVGLGSAAANVHKDIYKTAKLGLTDRALPVRVASASVSIENIADTLNKSFYFQCIVEMINYASFLYTVEIDNLSQLCYRALEGGNYEVRCSIARLLGILLAATQNPSKETFKGFPKGNSLKLLSLEEALSVLMSGFLRGGTSFLKGTGEMIKGASSVSREIRVGVTQAYVLFMQELGSTWLERNMSVILNHLTELVSSPKASTSHVDAVYSRKCLSFILSSTVGKMLGEKAQMGACKELIQVIIRHVNALDVSCENAKDNSENSQHVITCFLQELGNLILSLNTACSSLIQDTHMNLLDAVVAVLLHPVGAARLAAAWCLRCICVALPSQLHPLIVRCCDRLDALKSSPEAISGYSSALASLVGCVHLTPLGIPHMRGKILFNIAEELLRSANQNSRLSLHRTQAGWLIIGSIMPLGVSVVRALLPRMLLLWKNSFPRSSKEIESEKARGDAFTWQVTMEGRAGALASMCSFLLRCPELAAEDTIRRLLLPIEAALLMLSSISNIVKQYGQHLKASTAMVRLRLYEVLYLLPTQSYEGHYTTVLKLLVSEFTLSESGANTTTSLLRTVCHTNTSMLLGTSLHDTNHKILEDQLLSNSASGSGAIEHDFTYLYRPLPEGVTQPDPLPLGIAVIDASVLLFGQMFPLVANKHRLKLITLFNEIIHAAKSHRQEAVQTNIFAALLYSFKNMADQKFTFGQDDVKDAAAELLLNGLTHPNPFLRFASGEAIGRMAQVVGDPRFVAEMAQNSFDKLKSARDAISRTGHSVALGSLHRYVGGMGSGQHLSTSISILLALAKDVTSPLVQVWALYALFLIADSGGPMFRAYVEPALALLLELLLSVPSNAVSVHHCISKCLQALIINIGPELQGNSSTVVMARWSLLCACGVVGEHPEPVIQAEAITCLQQLHMFAPRHVNLSTLVPMLIGKLKSKHLSLRRAAVSCLRQLSQKEAWEVCEHAANMSHGKLVDSLPDTGLPGIFFGLLDTETDPILIQYVHHTITYMLQALAVSCLSLWLTLCREVLTSSSDSGNEVSSADGGTEAADEDDAVQIHTGEDADYPSIPPRWTTRVFASHCIIKIIQECENDDTHFDLSLARKKQNKREDSDFLVFHLSEIVRMGFVGATSDCDQLRLEGLNILHLVIEKFAYVPEPEFPGHVILEQYQAQVGAALRPAFAPDTSSHVTARACEVCSAWICSGVAHDLNDLRRVHQLLVSSLAKLNEGKTKGLYNESAETLEKLSILKAWAEVYVVSIKETLITPLIEDDLNDSDNISNKSEECLLNLVSPELVVLSKYWLAALKDYALLSLPPEFSSQLPHDGGVFYSNETADGVRKYYSDAWPSILHAAASWLNGGGFVEQNELNINEKETSNKAILVVNTERFYLLLGICLQWLCSSCHGEDPERSIVCINALETLLVSSFSSKLVGSNENMSFEIATVMHRQILSSDLVEIHQGAINVISLIVSANVQALEEAKRKKHGKDGNPANYKCSGCEADLIGEGGESGEINTSHSLVFTALQASLCTLVRYLPEIAPHVVASAPSLLASIRSSPKKSALDLLISSILNLLVAVPNLCSPAGGVAVLPTVLYLSFGVLKEYKNSSHDEPRDSTFYPNPLTTVLDALANLAQHPFSSDSRSCDQWCHYLQSALSTIIDMGKTSETERQTDEVMVLRGIAQLVLHSPSSVSSPHNLQYPALNLFKLAVQHHRLDSIFSHADPKISMPYIHALAPRLLEYLYTPPELTCQKDFQLITESLSALELLIPRTLPTYRTELIGVLASMMIGFLQEPSLLGTVSAFARQLHHHALGRLQKIGPDYPQEFKCVLANKPDLKLKLENALKGQKDVQKQAEPAKPVTYQPTIKLKTDFSDFVSQK